MSSRIAQRSAALLALRWHAGTGTLVALTAALTLAGALPALTVLGGTSTAPSLSLALGQTGALLGDWGGRGVVWPQLQQLALLQLLSMVRSATILTLMVGAATLLALHLARTASRSGEVIVARSIGASRRDITGALFLEAGALASVALCIGMLLALAGVVLMRTAWPGRVGPVDILLTVSGTLGVTALVMAAPLLMVRALSTTRLVDDDRRPLTLIIPALQLGAALVVLAGGSTLRAVTMQQRSMTPSATGSTVLQEVEAVAGARLARAKRFAAFLDARHADDPSALVSIASSGAHRGLGVIAQATSDCGKRCTAGVNIRGATETVAHHAVSGDTFALMGLRLLAGRALGDRDRWDSPLVAVVNASAARTMFPNGDAVGRRIQLTVLDDRWFEVIGVVDDAPALGLGGVMQPALGVYVSVLQQPIAEAEVATPARPVPTDALRTIGNPRSAPTSIVAILATDTRTLHWFTTLLLAMGGITALIAVGGLVAMLRLWLDSQQRELGIRRAVGASRAAVHRLVLGRATLVAIGGSLFGAWLGQIFWDVLPRIVPGAPAFDTAVVLQTGVALSLLTLAVAWLMAARFTRTPIGALLIDVG